MFYNPLPIIDNIFNLTVFQNNVFYFKEFNYEITLCDQETKYYKKIIDLNSFIQLLKSSLVDKNWQTNKLIVAINDEKIFKQFISESINEVLKLEDVKTYRLYMDFILGVKHKEDTLYYKLPDFLFNNGIENAIALIKKDNLFNSILQQRNELSSQAKFLNSLYSIIKKNNEEKIIECIDVLIENNWLNINDNKVLLFLDKFKNNNTLLEYFSNKYISYNELKNNQKSLNYKINDFDCFYYINWDALKLDQLYGVKKISYFNILIEIEDIFKNNKSILDLGILDLNVCKTNNKEKLIIEFKLKNDSNNIKILCNELIEEFFYLKLKNKENNDIDKFIDKKVLENTLSIKNELITSIKSKGKKI